MNQSSWKVGFAPGEQRCPHPSARAEGHDARVEAKNGTIHSLPRPDTLNPLRLCVRRVSREAAKYAKKEESKEPAGAEIAREARGSP